MEGPAKGLRRRMAGWGSALFATAALAAGFALLDPLGPPPMPAELRGTGAARTSAHFSPDSGAWTVIYTLPMQADKLAARFSKAGPWRELPLTQAGVMLAGSRMSAYQSVRIALGRPALSRNSAESKAQPPELWTTVWVQNHPRQWSGLEKALARLVGITPLEGSAQAEPALEGAILFDRLPPAPVLGIQQARQLARQKPLPPNQHKRN